jgi:hypothetical protein
MIEEQPWVGLLIGLAAVTPFVVQASIFTRNQRRHRSWVRAVGVVLHTHATSTSDGVRTYRASYNYTDPTGTIRSGRGEIDRDAPHGTELPILYDPENPATSQPQRRIGVGHWIAGGLGLLLFVVGVFGVVQSIHIMVTGSMLGE